MFLSLKKTTVIALMTLLFFSSCQKDPVVENNTSKQITEGFVLDADTLGILTTTKVADTYVHLYHSTSGAQVNSYAIESRNKIVIVDALHFQSRGEEMRNFANFLEKDIERVLVSHAHADHYMALGNFKDLPTYATSDAITNIANEGEATRLFRISLGEPFLSEYPDSVTIPENVVETSFTVDDIKYETFNFINTEAKDQMLLKIPSLKMIHTADLVTIGGHQILIDPEQIINAIQYIKALEGEGYTTLLTGHNGMEDMSVLDPVLQYLYTAKSILDTNPTAADYQTQIEAAYPSYGDASFVVLLMDNAGAFN